MAGQTEGSKRNTSAFFDSMVVLANEVADSLRAAASVTHRGTQGGLRERRFRRVMRPFIPPRFRLLSGQVVNASGASSRQQDCLIVDAHRTALIVDESDEGIVPAEMVAACIELKSKCDPEKVREGVQGTASAKSLIAKHWRQHRYPHPTGGTWDSWVETKMFTSIICLTGPRDSRAVEDSFFAENSKLDPENRCNALLILDRAFLTWGTDEASIQFWPPQASRGSIFRSRSPAHLFFLHHYMLTKHLEQYDFPLMSIEAYMKGPWGEGLTHETRDIQ